MSGTLARNAPSRGLVWHIFRKDWRLLWPLAVATAATQALLMVLIRHSEPFPMRESLSAVAALVTLGLAIGMTLLIVLSIQHEAIPSINQDWLVRPVKRRDLLLGKLLSLVLLVHGPIVAVHVVQGLAEGFPPGSVLHATLVSNFEVALCYTLPVMAIAAMTRSVVEAIIFGLAIALVSVLAGFVFSTPTGGTGLKWIWRSLSHAELLLVTIAAIGWQYFRRSRDSTQQARALFACGMVLFTLIPALPWGPAFSIQRAFSAHPQASRPVTVAVEPGGVDPGAVNPVAASDLDRQILAEAKKADSPDPASVRLALPVRFSGLPAGALVHADRTDFRLVRGDGTVVYRGLGHVFDLPADGAGTVRQTLQIPADVYAKIADQPLRLELEYFATLLRGVTVSSPVPLNDARRVPGFGWCATRVDSKSTSVEVGCRQIVALPFCISMALQPQNGPEKFVCELNYEPVPLRFSVDPIDHVEATVPMGDQKGAEVTIRVYEPEDHFFRAVVVSGLRPKEWRMTSP